MFKNQLEDNHYNNSTSYLSLKIMRAHKNYIYADLHNHTTASDGDFSPKQLIERMSCLGIKVAGITDHDTLGGLKEAFETAKELPIEVLPGVEVSLCFRRPEFTGSLHLLCYFAKKYLEDDYFIRTFEGFLSQARGKALIRRRVKKINQEFGSNGRQALLKKDLSYEEITGFSTNASRRHFAMALVQYHKIEDKKLISRIIGNNSPAYIPSGIDLSSAKQLIESIGLIPVLAHPAAGSFPGKGHYREVLPPVDIVEKLMPDLLSIGLKGLEVYYPGHTEEHQELLRSWAKKHDLLVTGGSDCHDSASRPPGIAGLGKQDYLKLKVAIART